MKVFLVRFWFLVVVSMKMSVLWVVAITLIMEAASTSKMSTTEKTAIFILVTVRTFTIFIVY